MYCNVKMHVNNIIIHELKILRAQTKCCAVENFKHNLCRVTLRANDGVEK